MPGGCGRLRSLPALPTCQTGTSTRWAGPQGARGVSSKGGREDPATRPCPLCRPCAPCPGSWRERDSARAGRGSEGACSCRVSTERSDAVHESWKQAGETGWDVEGAAEPQEPLRRPHCAGAGRVPRDKREDFPVLSSHLSPNPVQTDPPWALGGSNCPTPSRGQHQAI